MEKRRINKVSGIMKKLAAAALVLAVVSVFTACSGGQEEASEDLKVIYDCYSENEVEFSTGNGKPVKTREHLFVVENVSDKSIGEAKIRIDALDENGDALTKTAGTSGVYHLPYLMPGEKAVVSCMDAEWTDVPAGFRTEITGGRADKGSGAPLTITSASETSPYSWEITVKNDGDSDVKWVNGSFVSGDSEDDAERMPVLFAVVKDEGDGKIVREGAMLKGDDFAIEDINIAPGEEYTAGFSFDAPLEDPEFIVCWRI